MASASGCLSNCSRSGLLGHDWTTEELWAPWLVLADYFEYQPWLFSLLGSAMVGLSGVFPLLVIPIDEADDLKHGGMRRPLSAIGFSNFVYRFESVPTIFRMSFFLNRDLG